MPVLGVELAWLGQITLRQAVMVKLPLMAVGELPLLSTAVQLATVAAVPPVMVERVLVGGGRLEPVKSKPVI